VVSWKNSQNFSSKSYICGFCGNSLASNQGFVGEASGKWSFIYICHFCGKPTFFDSMGSQTPGPIFGKVVKDIPLKEVSGLYDEARKCISCGAYTASVLCSRKLLMSIAVSKGAKEGLGFIEYVEYLVNKGFVPPDGKGWVDHIRRKGNEANHQIIIMEQGDAEELVTFIEMLLKFIYEFPAAIKRKIDSVSSENT
jgi:hypothetical protein